MLHRLGFLCLTCFTIKELMPRKVVLFSSDLLAANGVKDPLSIDVLIEDFAKDTAKKHNNYAVWWDMNAEKDILKENPRYRNYKMSVSTGPVKYSDASIDSMMPRTKLVQWYHNHQHNESQKTLIRKTTTHTHAYTWTVDRTYSLEQTLKFSLNLPQSFNFESTTKSSLSMRSGSQDQKTDTTSIYVEQQIVIPPRRSVKVTWIVHDIVQDMSWSANVTLRGWFAVWYHYRLNGHFLWFYPIDFISGPGLNRVEENGLMFVANGTFKGVSGADSSLRVEEHDLQQYSRKPLKVTYYPVPMPWNTPGSAVAGTTHKPN